MILHKTDGINYLTYRFVPISKARRLTQSDFVVWRSRTCVTFRMTRGGFNARSAEEGQRPKYAKILSL